MADEHREVIVERSGGNGLTALVAIIVLALIAIGVFAVVQNQSSKDNAISTAAHQVGDAAEKAGDAAKDAAGSSK